MNVQRSTLKIISIVSPPLLQLAIFGTLRGGSWTWLVPIVGYVLVPIADLFIGEDSYNPTVDEEAALKKNIWFRVVTWLYVVALTATLGVALHTIATHELAMSELVGITSAAAKLSTASSKLST